MSEGNNRDLTEYRGGFIQDLAIKLKLILRLMSDSRVSMFVKSIPVFSLAYLIWPLDIPLPFDDAAIIWLGMYLFIEMCPPEVVEEHLARLRGMNMESWRAVVSQPEPGRAEPEDVIDGEFREE